MDSSLPGAATTSIRGNELTKHDKINRAFTVVTSVATLALGSIYLIPPNDSDDILMGCVFLGFGIVFQAILWIEDRSRDQQRH